MKITAERLREVMGYDPETGEFRWRERPVKHFRDGNYSAQRICAKWNTCYAGKIAGGDDGNGYLRICIDGRQYQAHRLAWLYVTGEWPASDLDHRDLDKANNRFLNLRPATKSQNGSNTRAPITNTSGVKGVCWHKAARKWRVQIGTNGGRFHLGYFDEDKIEEASAAYTSAATKYFGEFARAL